jgi:hypothetical protein
MILRLSKRRNLVLFTLSFLLCACGREVIPTAQTYESIPELLNALEDAGAGAVPLDLEATLLDVPARGILLNGEKVVIYEFETIEARSRGVTNLQSALDENWMNASNESPAAKIWSHNRLLIVYFGRDGGTVLLLSGLLGDPLQKPFLAEDEPFPPAVPAAILALANSEGVDPSTIDVLGYDSVEWRDGCLEVPRSGEVCTQVVTPGWRIRLLLEGQAIEIHSDEMGGEIRWR